MQEKYLEKIDFHRILFSISSYVSISDTVVLLGKQHILKTEEEVSQICFLVKLIRDLIEVYDDYPNSCLQSIGNSIALLLKQNSIISVEEIKNIIFFLREVLKIMIFLDKSEFNFRHEVGVLKKLLFVEPSLKDLLEILCNYIDVDALKIKRGVVKDYDEIDFEIKNLDKRINRQLKQIIGLNSKYLTSVFVCYKFSKYTIALKSSFKNKIKGNIISISSSGETFYVEPNEIVSDSNRLAFLSLEKERIVLRILQGLSDKIHGHISLLSSLYDNFLYYDSLKVRAIYGIKTQGVFPRFDGSLNIVNARHPLIQHAKSINFCPLNNRVVIITGPNAGGKTATLKTVALLSAMFQFGIPVPVDESSTFKIFDNILVNIGDDQSIANSLSTFSSHMNNISYILNCATRNSLLVFDEFCSGTDIEQGQALAVAILEHLIDIESYVIISTHYSALKYFAYTHEFVINASMQMDLEKMEPNYNLIFLVPGESFAFSVASKSSINASILFRAKEIYSSNKTEVNEILERLARKEREIYLLEEELKDKLKLIEMKEIDISNIREAIILRERDLEEKLVNEQKEFLKSSRKTLENLVREIKEGSVCTIKNKKFVSNISDNITAKATKIRLLNQDIVTKVEFKVGDKVRVFGSSSSGEIIGVTRKGFIVNTGAFNITVGSFNLEKILDNKQSKKNFKQNFDFSFENQDDVLDLIIDIRGMRVVEAIDFLNKKIDNMLLRNICRFEIIHGKGEGFLMERVHAFLKDIKFVKKYYFARPSDGGVGKTIVEI
ncbi:Endonuclease MutS2 [Borrelia miyamotoi]|uniref:endonuclease MutS2 n=1 Tax=Borrelia miyamotoi TaxID=47466 RepID=UPI001C7644CE|nr:endonuclease MutS2 [Borrelia miyamotoi]BCR19049.1 Endonuclease MutS2 [Borrelia miyamotoi]BCR19882.1 Endonuclease MutS2 [Borrelia miyamotoi]